MSPAAKKQTKSKIPAQLTPRERQRLAEKNKKKRIRRKRFVVFSFFFIITALISGTVYGFFTVFKITDYAVTGSKTYTAEQVYESSGLKLGKNLFLSNLGSAEKQLESNLPYIGSVQIRRVLPGTLKYEITETKATAALSYGNRFLLLNSDGKVLEQKTGTKPDNLYLLKCPAPVSTGLGQTIGFSKTFSIKTEQTVKKKKTVTVENYNVDMLQVYKDLSAAVQSSKIKGITVIDMSNPLDVSLVYKDRLTLHIGSPTQINERLVLAASVIKREDADYPDEKGTIDLTILKKAFVQTTAKAEGTTSAEITTVS